ncbi:MAG: HEAT repeat domain-containing protein [Acidobacteria bacterium]|nr:HEAT repeat domain-containing protein [Acidobacteriota bacterium]
MEKLVERDKALPRSSLRGAPALAVQFFLVPLAVIAVLVSIYAGFRALTKEERTAEEYLSDIRFGGRDRRWPAAYELSHAMADPTVQQRNPTLGRSLVQAFAESKGDDPRVRRYLALAIGRLKPPPADASTVLADALRDPDSETVISVIWALGALGDRSAAPALQQMYESSDAGIRKITVYSLGALGGDAQMVTLRTALADPAADVRWNAAVALARHGDPEARPVLHRMLDRTSVEQQIARMPRSDADADPAGDIMVSALRAIAALHDTTARELARNLSEHDRSLRVREAAMNALKQIGA